MQLVLGIILGFFLAIGVAYVSDAGSQQVCSVSSQKCPIVNWDEANLRFRNVSDSLHSTWDRLTHHEKG